MTIKAVLFDFDGTLADTLPLSFLAFQSVFRQYDRRELSTEELVARFGPTEDGIIRGHLNNQEQVEEAIRMYYRLYGEGHSQHVHAVPAIHEMLDELRAANLKLGIITGKSREAFQISAEALQLSPYFDVVVTGDDVVSPKPHPEGLLRALAKLGVRPEEAVFIGDSSADIAAGQAAEVRTFGAHWLPTHQSSIFAVAPERVFTDVESFVQLILAQGDGAPHRWLDWAKQLQAIAQTGLTYVKDVYDRERYEALREISVEIMEQYTLAGEDVIRMAFANETGYATPKVDVRGVVFQNNHILLVREKADGAWALPGGWADIGYSPSEIAVKEVREEAGFEVEAVKLLAVLDKKFHDHPPSPYHVYKLFILCRIVGGSALGGVETSEVGFFAEDDLPPLSVERNTEKQLHLMFEYLRNLDKGVLLD
ncbi:NUDIX hydrolase N-terminal domain-containing protein [Paenibacillus cremeus]|uniref:NUDIX hydrolase N-terminal domain-containing protein n=1 Tax=Paenibacillus cremeus TaxID=2163881 RepID=UPI0028F6ED98|nr:NUDIX hydrolase N-terminal domain-containing protein [Paenibacillus cremeus]